MVICGQAQKTQMTVCKVMVDGVFRIYFIFVRLFCYFLISQRSLHHDCVCICAYNNNLMYSDMLNETCPRWADVGYSPEHSHTVIIHIVFDFFLSFTAFLFDSLLGFVWYFASVKPCWSPLCIHVLCVVFGFFFCGYIYFGCRFCLFFFRSIPPRAWYWLILCLLLLAVVECIQAQFHANVPFHNESTDSCRCSFFFSFFPPSLCVRQNRRIADFTSHSQFKDQYESQEMSFNIQIILLL